MSIAAMAPCTGRALLFSGTNNPAIEYLVNSLFGEFSDAAAGLSSGIEQVVRHGERVIATLYLIHRTAMSAPGLNQTYMAEVMKAKGTLVSAKLFNYVLTKVPDSQRDAIDMMFGGVKTQMCQALELLNEEYAPMVSPSIDEVVEHIKRHGGIKGLGMAYMSRKQEEQRAAQREQETREERLKQIEREEREQVARTNGFSSYDEYVVEENRKAEAIKFDKVRKFLAGRGEKTDIASGLEEGRFYLYVGGELRLISPDDERKLMHCAASLI